MKKNIIRIAVGVLVLLVAAAALSIFFLGSIVKKAVEEVGPKVTQVSVNLDGADVVVLPGRIELKGLALGNPEKYKSKLAIKVENVSVHFNSMSALSDKMIISSINVKSPEITVEGGLQDNNLTAIQKNVNDYVNGSGATKPAQAAPTTPTEAKAGKKLQIDDFVITGAKLHLLITAPISLGENVNLTLPDIHLTGLGAGPEGITAAEVTQKAMTALLNSIAANAADLVSKYGADAVSKLQDAAKSQDFKKAREKLKGLFGH